MAEYSFVTIWRIDAPIEKVWNALRDFKRMPSWWKYVQSVVELEPGDENGVGSLVRIVWTSALPYKLRFDTRTTRAQKPRLIELDAMGELNGTGRWQLSEEDGVTVVRYDWNVSTTKQWMNLLAPLLRPVFEWNHDILMNEGGRSLARLLNARLLNEPEQQTNGLPRALGGLAAATGAVTVAYVLWASRRKRK